MLRFLSPCTTLVQYYIDVISTVHALSRTQRSLAVVGFLCAQEERGRRECLLR